MTRRIFDPDLTMRYMMPTDVAFPVQARLHVDYLPGTLLVELAQTLARNPSGYVLLVAFDDSATPVMARVQTPEGAPQIWVPWSLCSPDMATLVN